MNALRIASMLIGPAPDARMTLCTKSIPHRREGAQAFWAFVPVFSAAVPAFTAAIARSRCCGAS
jgi:hypothetical protein